MIPTMIPKIPRADAKISTIKTLTKRDESWASARAHDEPAIPTAIPLAMLVNPTDSPDEKTAYLRRVRKGVNRRGGARKEEQGGGEVGG